MDTITLKYDEYSALLRSSQTSKEENTRLKEEVKKLKERVSDLECKFKHQTGKTQEAEKMCVDLQKQVEKERVDKIQISFDISLIRLKYNELKKQNDVLKEEVAFEPQRKEKVEFPTFIPEIKPIRPIQNQKDFVMIGRVEQLPKDTIVDLVVEKSEDQSETEDELDATQFVRTKLPARVDISPTPAKVGDLVKNDVVIENVEKQFTCRQSQDKNSVEVVEGSEEIDMLYGIDYDRVLQVLKTIYRDKTKLKGDNNKWAEGFTVFSDYLKACGVKVRPTKTKSKEENEQDMCVEFLREFKKIENIKVQLGMKRAVLFFEKNRKTVVRYLGDY
ncbi:hypothetical protein EIN_404980 [Entamoeba invadens IP1]|uniref:Uncharacterized protein n=1 Tax=Entamoeba invadens IP1 TaxID=370355 RepID=A0A0A1UCR4_ENTIV|nr:hypothetical protein EIN_404980 [Entamoeba invadens IP1]ELP90084.1 hypothetical protein EIN_404980 [Entamoeba invadens IP1]|eukprot:XP_004256855.1 hypothetical protein EIN_404980 [Entamoeba invadens IP1]